MNRIDHAFQEKNKNILNVYFTAGYPNLDDTAGIIKALAAAGADLIEIGIPYSDPVADGPTIQASNDVSLANGMTIKKLFDQLEGIRNTVDIPLILMGYFNPVMQYGLEAFCQRCQQVGIDGLILPDLPVSVYMSQYKQLFDSYGLHNIFLITPNTSEERIRQIDDNSAGFIYMVSSASTTGAKSDISNIQEAYFDRVNGYGLKNPRLIGFGISNYETFKKACAYANGAIIGSAFINLIKESTNLEKDINDYVRSVKGA